MIPDGPGKWDPGPQRLVLIADGMAVTSGVF
jgi:hypothetical protein